MKVTIVDLIRREGREPGGGRPRIFEITYYLGVYDPKALKRLASQGIDYDKIYPKVRQ
jgi:hypothetical protein